MAIIFPTSLGELQVNLYPQDENKIRVEVIDKKKWEDLKSEKEGIGKDCFFGGRSVYETIEQGCFERHGKMPPLSEQIISPNQQKVPSWCEMEQQRRSGVQRSGLDIW
ncbi:hypothetical protein [Wolbachia endosymbiont of Tettigetta isshikii]|uniref:hypothetical protein n=1 Tax=Wolbachia endosymbiont of Tettigetta isshikii TaxID=3239093 RepID=UPI00397EE26B